MIDVVDDTVAKIVLVMDDGDSINRVSEKIGHSYSWTHEVVRDLGDIGIVERHGDGFRVADPEVRDAFRQVVQTVTRYGIDRDEAYVIPQFAGMTFAFSHIDAAYVWTHGGYQVARDYTDYPVFLTVAEGDIDAWLEFFSGCGIDAFVEERDGEGIYFVLFPVETVDRKWVNGKPVIPLQDAIAWMQQYRANFQPALAIIAEEYADRPEIRSTLDSEEVASQ